MINNISPFLSKHNIPISSYSRNINLLINSNNFEKYDLSWEKINYNENINFKHFDNILTKEKIFYIYLLKINAIPALIIIIDRNEKNVKEFVFNKSLILMLDAGSEIRLSFYKKFKNINFKNALNKNIFMII